MFDLRYHVASLTAVFLALIIGILVGVGITSSGAISTDERDVFRERIDELRRQLEERRGRVDSLTRELRAAQAFVEHTYPPLMDGRLAGRRVAVLFVGRADGRVRTSVEQALDAADAPGAVRLRALKVPVEVAALRRLLARQRELPASSDLVDVGRALAREFVDGGETPLWALLSNLLVEEQAGNARRAADAVVVARTAEPQTRGTARLLAGFYDGLARERVPAVGVEVSDAALSAVPVYRDRGLSSVDDVETRAGRLALALLLAGGAPGHYGVKPTADDGLLPPIAALRGEAGGG